MAWAADCSLDHNSVCGTHVSGLEPILTAVSVPKSYTFSIALTALLVGNIQERPPISVGLR